MRKGALTSIALAMGLMVSPEGLALLGNAMGRAGWFFLPAILCAGAVHLMTVTSLRQTCSSCPAPGGEALLVREALGPAAALFPLLSRVVLAVCLSPIVFSTAGFVFNEVFLSWFPNFTFAYLLLGLLFGVNLLRRQAAETMQAVFVGVVIGGLLVLSVVAFASGAGARHETAGGAMTAEAAAGALVLLLGFDLGLSGGSRGGERFSSPLVFALALAAVVFILWGAASLLHVPAAKLAGTTIPHTVAARSIMGQAGRVVMGVVVITGAAAAMNALYIALPGMAADMAARGLLPGFLHGRKGRGTPLLAVMAGGGALMMASGMAGEPVTAVLLRGAFLLWLMTYALIHLSVLRRALKGFAPGMTLLSPLLGGAVTLTGAMVLVSADEEAGTLVSFMAVVAAVSAALGLALAARGTSREDSRTMKAP
jgi:amino acid transporter